MFARSGGKELLDSIPSKVSVNTIFLGNSTMACGLDLNTYIDGSGKSKDDFLKLALGGTSIQEMALFLDVADRRGIKVRNVVLGFHDLNLEDISPRKIWDFYGALNLVFFVNSDIQNDVYKLNWIDKLLVQTMSFIPVVVYRSNLWGRVELLRRAIEQFGTNSLQVGSYGRIEDFKQYPYNSTVRDSVHQTMANISYSKILPSSLLLIKKICDKHAARLILVQMPLSHDRLNLCKTDSRWMLYQQRVRDVSNMLKASYIDCSDWIVDEASFEDPVHLNKDIGSKKFSALLVKAINSLPF